ncbi:MAG: hypothetical protein R3D29_10860 [Nitratireductor sp.]
MRDTLAHCISLQGVTDQVAHTTVQGNGHLSADLFHRLTETAAHVLQPVSRDTSKEPGQSDPELRELGRKLPECQCADALLCHSPAIMIACRRRRMKTGTYDAYEPQLELQVIDRDIWVVDGPVLYWGYGVPEWPFPTRMTIIRLPQGGLWPHSPVKPNDNLRRGGQGARTGRTHRLAKQDPPCIDWRLGRAVSDARLWGSPGVRERSKLVFTDDLDDSPPGRMVAGD